MVVVFFFPLSLDIIKFACLDNSPSQVERAFRALLAVVKTCPTPALILVSSG